MSWKIVKRGKRWVVQKKVGGRVVSKHDTEEQAIEAVSVLKAEQERLIKAMENN